MANNQRDDYLETLSFLPQIESRFVQRTYEIFDAGLLVSSSSLMTNIFKAEGLMKKALKLRFASEEKQAAAVQ